MNEMKVNVENIGGLTKPVEFVLRKGVNVIKAPNAIGKTSFVNGLRTMILPENDLKKHTEFLNDFSTQGRVEIIANEKTIYRTLRPGREGLSIVGDAYYTDGRRADLLAIAVPDNEFLDTVLKGRPLDDFLDEFSESKYYKELISWCKDRHRELLMELNKYIDTVTRFSVIQKQIEKYEKGLEKARVEQIKIEPAVETIRKEKFDERLEERAKKSERRDVLYSGIGGLKYNVDLKEKEIPRLNKEIKRLDVEIAEFHKRHPDITKEIDRLYDRIIERKKLKYQINAEIDELEVDIEATEEGKGDRCRECGRPFSPAQRKSRIDELRRKLTEKRKELVRVSSETEETEIERSSLIEDRDRVLKDMSAELKDKSGTLTQYERDVKDWKEELAQKIPEMKKLEEEISELDKAIDPKTRELLHRASEIKGRIGEIEGILRIHRDEVAGLSEAQKEVQKLQIKSDTLKSAIPYLTEKMNQLQNRVRKRFNQRVMEVYNLLGFKDFENIEIDDMNRLTVKRRYGTRVKTQELNRLSSSERVTIGIIVMLAGKEEYLADFPLFVLDEWQTAYDPKRFEEITSYLEKHVPFVVVTALTPTGESIRIEHK